MKAPSPLLGFNNNVRHKGRVFHIQTEDSGIRHPHIITHLFADGGRILKTTKTSYAEHLGQERLAETVRGMMQEQHKAMFIALRDGQFDYLFDENASGPGGDRAGRPRPDPKPPEAPPAPSAPQPAAVIAPAEPEPAPAVVTPVEPEVVEPELVEAEVAEAQVAEAEPAPVVIAAAAPEASTMEAPHPHAIFGLPAEALLPPAPRVHAPSPAALAMARPAAHFAPTEPAQLAATAPIVMPEHPLDPGEDVGGEAPLDVATGGARRRGTSRPTLDVDPGAIHGVSSGEPSIDLDLDALERAAAEAQTPFFQQIQDLPPPPASVLGSKRASTGGYSVRSPAPPPMGRSEPGDPGPGAQSGAPRPATLGGAPKPPPRPAPPTETPKPPPAGATAPRPAPRPGALGETPKPPPAMPGIAPKPPAPKPPARPVLGGAPKPAVMPAVPSPGRYAPSRPASIFATTRPQEGASIFGEDLISEKSLDEVILGYLAEDLDGPAEKK